jgi:hypothetical protein
MATTVKSGAGIELDDAERREQAVQHLGAQHRALVIGRDEDHRPAFVQQVAHLHRPPGVVRERHVERHLGVEVALDVDALQDLRRLVRRQAAIETHGSLRRRQ